MINKTDLFLEGLLEIARMGVDDGLRHQVGRCFLDYLGATLAGAEMLGGRGLALLDGLGCGRPECSVIGFQRKASLHTAAFVNGFSSHTAELDDGVIAGIIHPGAPIFSALLAVAEKDHITFERFCVGAVIGYEACVRMAKAIQPAHKKLGYHATATCGLVGATLAVSTALEFNRREIQGAFAAAIASAHGTLKVLEDDSELKPFNVATSASDAIVAAIVGRAGFQGPVDSLSGYAGFLDQFANAVDEVQLYRKPGGDYCINEVYVKPYAACRYCHPSIENALSVRTREGFDVEQIERIEVRTYALAVNKHDQTEVGKVSAAKMSIPFGVAVSLFSGAADAGAYSQEIINNEMVKRLAKKVAVIPDEAFSAEFPAKSIATLKVTMSDGSVFEAKTDKPKGESSDPLSDDELRKKFLSLASFSKFSSVRAESLADELLKREPNLSLVIRELC